MSAADDTQPAEQVSVATSLKDRLARRRVELTHNEPFVLDVPEYPDIAVRYHALGFRRLRTIGARHEKKTLAEAELYAAADTLINACEEILEKREDGSTVGTGYQWGVRAARDLFDVDLPDGTTARQALFAIFGEGPDDGENPWDLRLTSHFTAWDERTGAIDKAVQDKLAGESPASS